MTSRAQEEQSERIKEQAAREALRRRAVLEEEVRQATATLHGGGLEKPERAAAVVENARLAMVLPSLMVFIILKESVL